MSSAGVYYQFKSLPIKEVTEKVVPLIFFLKFFNLYIMINVSEEIL